MPYTKIFSNDENLNSKAIVKVEIHEPKWINRIHMSIWFIFHGYNEVRTYEEIPNYRVYITKEMIK
jgi:hypothetical protein